MNPLKIVFLDAYTNNPGDISFDPIASLGEFRAYQRTDRSELAERAAEAEILIVNKFVIDEAALVLMPKVKYIVVAATGYNNIDVAATSKRNISVSNVRAYSTESVTQHVFALLLAIQNKVEYYDTQVKSGRWAQSADFCFYDHPIFEIAGMTLGLLGYGTIGKRVAQVAAAFGMTVIATTRNMTQEKPDYLQFVDLDTLLASSDVLSLHCPLTEETREVIQKKNLQKMKSSAILINTGRGALIRENDLFYALDHGLIRGAALDVLTQEPPHFSNPLLHHTRCVVTPHVAWAGQNARMALIAGIAENIKSFQTGKLLNEVYP